VISPVTSIASSQAEREEEVAAEVVALMGSRLFYCPKASRAEREAGCESLPDVRRTDGRTSEHHVPNLRTSPRRNHHPCVKPLSLMRWLVKMVTPPGGTVLDPFMGSGSTGCAAVLEGFRFIGFDIVPEYVEIAQARIEYWGKYKE
jgi:site-specific DNA-methyltransferase (adenine-specific)